MKNITARVEEAIARTHGIKLNGALTVEFDGFNNDKCRVYDMNFTTFNKTYLGIYSVKADAFFKI